MSGEDDLLNGILPMISYGILDPKYLTGKESEEDSETQDDMEESRKDKSGGGSHGGF